MYYYFILYGFSLMGLIFAQNSKKVLPVVLFLIWLMIVFVVGFRGFEVGVDTESYVGIFNEIYSGNEGRFVQERVNFGYYYLNKLVGFFTNSPTVLFIAVASIFSFCILSTIHKFNFNIVISFLIFMGLGLFFYMHNVLRESLAVAVLFFSIRYFVNKKYLKFLLGCLVALSFHNSVIGFIPLILVAMLPINATTYFIAWLIGFANFLKPIGIGVLQSAINLTPLAKYSHYLDPSSIDKKVSSLTVGLGFLSYQILFLVILFAYYRCKAKYSYQELIFTRLSMISLIFSTMFFQFGYLTRIANYGQPFILLALPIAVSYLFKGNSRLFAYILLSAYLIMLFIKGVLSGASGITPYSNVLFG